MSDKDDRRAQALRANLRRRKTWQRNKAEAVKADETKPTKPTEADSHTNIGASTDKTKPDDS